MALKKCSECKKEISSTVSKCPQCGAEQFTFAQGCAGLVVLAVVCWGVYSFYIDPAPKPPEESAENACIMAQIYAKQELLAPSTADFEPCYEAEQSTTKGSDGVWSAYGYVDAENAFGAKLRQNYFVQMKFDKSDPSEWRKISVSVGGP